MHDYEMEEEGGEDAVEDIELISMEGIRHRHVVIGTEKEGKE
jgi:hypothetical protein